MAGKLYYSIQEVSDIVGVESHTIRFWEQEFKKLRPPKSKGGTRRYRKEDIDLIKEIKELLYTKKFTIEGANIALNEKKAGKKGSGNKNLLTDVKKGLRDILRMLGDDE